MSHIVIETPQATVVVTKNGVASFVWNKNFVPKWTRQYQNAQVYLDGEVLRLSEPYMPKDKGVLIRSGRLFTEVGSGLVQWSTPYARYVYEGKVMVGRKPKVVTNKDLRYQGAPKRGAHWFTRMMEVNGKRLIQRTAKIAGGSA